MKRTLIWLLPWMVAVASAQDALRPAEITLTHLGSAPAWRQGDACFVNPSALIGWHWPYTFVGNEATIQAEGRTIRVMGRTINTRFVLPMNEILDQLGADYAWRSDKDSLEAWASVRSIKVREGVIQADATLSVKPDIQWMDNPGRVVVDLKGAKLAANAILDLDASGKAAQLGASTVRIVFQTLTKPVVPSLDPSRAFDWNVGTTPNLEPQPIAISKGAQTPVEPPPPTAMISNVEVPADNDAGATIRMTASAKLPNARLRRVDPVILEIDLDRVGVPEGFIFPKTASLVGLESLPNATGITLRMTLARPMGVKFTALDNKIEIGLIKPRIGDGKLAGKIIVVDPGHGNGDSGAKSLDKTVFEKNLTLTIGNLVTNELSAHGATVIQTRTTDILVPLKERAEIANRNGAAFFVSVHINSNSTSTTSGTITFHHGGNAMGQLLAECIQNEIKKISGMPSIGVWSDTKIYSTGFAVLRYSKMPAVLLELGFINNGNDLKRMQEKSYQDAVAKAVAKGIRVYLGDVKP